MFGRRKTSIEYVVIDTETTGFHAESRIIELAMVVVSSEGKITEDFSTFLHGDGTVGHPMAARLHGIKTHQVASAPTFKEIFRTYSEFIDGRIPVAHNASFDRARLNYELKLIRKKETSPSDYPVVRIADKQNSSAMRGFDRRSIGEEQMSPTEHISRRFKRPAMLCEIGPLNKLSMILLLKRNECADDVS